MRLAPTRADAVPQDLVAAVIMALVHPKPILVTSATRLRQVEAQLEAVGAAMTPNFEADYCVVNCSADVHWSMVEPRLARASHCLLLLKRVDRLSQEVQLQLGYALMQQNTSLREFLDTSAFVLTTSDGSGGRPSPRGGSPGPGGPGPGGSGPGGSGSTTSGVDRLHPFLRRQILLKRSMDSLTEDAPLVELADVCVADEMRLQTAAIRAKIPQVTIVAELLRYIQDILMFVRTHRLARVGVRPQAAADFELLVRTLCVLEGRSFATPQVVKDAARLALPVHIRLCSAEDEPSLQYGGDYSTVKTWIKEWDSDLLVDSVLEECSAPC